MKMLDKANAWMYANENALVVAICAFVLGIVFARLVW